MARSRNIKPGFFTNDELAELPALTRLLFIGLWTLVDRDGRIEDRPKKIKAECMPYDDLDADAALSALCKAGFILRYEADNTRCIQVQNWHKHQNPHVKELASTLPAPDQHQTSTVLAPDKAQPKPEPARLIPDSGFLIPDSGFLIPDSSPLIPDSGFLVGAANAAPPAADAPAPKGCRLSPSWALPKAWGEWALAEFPSWTPEAVRNEADRFRDHWCAKSGKDATKLDWEATWRNWCRNARSPGPLRQHSVQSVAAEAARQMGFTTQHPDVIDA